MEVVLKVQAGPSAPNTGLSRSDRKSPYRSLSLHLLYEIFTCTIAVMASNENEQDEFACHTEERERSDDDDDLDTRHTCI